LKNKTNSWDFYFLTTMSQLLSDFIFLQNLQNL